MNENLSAKTVRTRRIETIRLLKVVVNVGIRASQSDPKFTETVERNLQRITGQKPVKTLAKQSISGFKIRKGMVVGEKVTLRGKRMNDFVGKLVHIAFPRTRDFWGLAEEAIDPKGNLSIGFTEHIAFPEIRSDEVEHLHGLQVTLVTNAGQREDAKSFFERLGFHFKKD